MQYAPTRAPHTPTHIATPPTRTYTHTTHATNMQCTLIRTLERTRQTKPMNNNMTTPRTKATVVYTHMHHACKKCSPRLHAPHAPTHIATPPTRTYTHTTHAKNMQRTLIRTLGRTRQTKSTNNNMATPRTKITAGGGKPTTSKNIHNQKSKRGAARSNKATANVHKYTQ